MSALRDSIEAYTNAAQKAKSDFSKLEKSDPKLVQDVEAILAFRVTPRLEQIEAAIELLEARIETLEGRG